MLKSLKNKLDAEYKEMYPGAGEIVGSIIAVALIAVFGYLWFKYL
jgi:hypothetical protein